MALVVDEERGVLYYIDASTGVVARAALHPPQTPLGNVETEVLVDNVVEPRGERRNASHYVGYR